MDNDITEEEGFIENQEDVNYGDGSEKKVEEVKKTASKRPIQRTKETLDIEPIEQDSSLIDNKNANSLDIDDPW